MAESERRLVAIMFTDMVGYTALVQNNESAALSLLEDQRNLVRPVLKKHNGKEIKTIGDSFLIEFPSALDAVQCAYDLQKTAREFNLSSAEQRKIHLRVGVNLGDVIRSDGDISGDAVNIASRIEPLAETDGVCVTRQVFDHVHNKFDLSFKSLGEVPLKNVIFAVEVFKMVMPWTVEGAPLLSSHKSNARRIAVLPFANMSPNSSDEFFADGLTEELIDKLSQVKGLEVIARTSVMSYKYKAKKISEIGKELSVTSLIEGSVRKSGNKIRVTVFLVDASTERHIWSSRYDRDLDDIFAIQSDIASNVVSAMPANLGLSQTTPARQSETYDIIAYSEFLRARELLHETAEEKIRDALGLFESAIQKDPNFARAYVGKGLCYWSLGMNAHIPFSEAIDKARMPIENAIKINPELAEAHAALSEVEMMEDRVAMAEKEARRAIEINPNLAEAYSSLAKVKEALGQIEESIKLREKAHQLDPLESWNLTCLGDEYFWSGRDSDALRIWETSMKLAPYPTFDSFMDYYINKKDYEKAEETIRKLQELEPNNPENAFWIGYLAAIRGDDEKAREMIEVLNESSKGGSVTMDGIGIIYCALGELDTFFAQMHKSLDAHTLSLSVMRYSPLVEKARADPRMRELLQTYETKYQ